MQTLAVIRTFTCMSEFPMILMFQHTKPKPASRHISRPEFILTHLLHSNIQSYRVCLDRCVMPTQMFHLCQQEKKRLDNRRLRDLFRSPAFITSACGSRSVQHRSRSHVLWPRWLSTLQDERRVFNFLKKPRSAAWTWLASCVYKSGLWERFSKDSPCLSDI